MIRRDVIYTGRVQGVGFRWTTNRIAKNYDVRGFVENREDGSVYMVAEGAEKDVEEFMIAIAENMGKNIKETRINQGRVGGDLTDFQVHY
ncbi:MAG: acylphosphatase [Planctomycetaceae bacterium]